MMKWLTDTYTSVKDNDLPNTFTFVVASILWPLGVIWWHNRKVNSVSNLLVAFIEKPGPIGINNIPYPAVDIWFENQTGSIVYITGPRIRNCSTRFPVPTTAVRDIGENVHPLSFLSASDAIFRDHQATLQTSGKAQSVMPVTTRMPQEFYQYNTPRWRRILRHRKYFILEYTAMVGEKKYRISTIR